jgi:uncharacterized phage protein (TIGR02216 family)
MSGFPWSEAMAFGLGVLRLSPGAFWTMTPRELAAAYDGAAGRKGAALERNDLEALMARHPDGERQ